MIYNLQTKYGRNLQSTFNLHPPPLASQNGHKDNMKTELGGFNFSYESGNPYFFYYLSSRRHFRLDKVDLVGMVDMVDMVDNMDMADN